MAEPVQQQNSAQNGQNGQAAQRSQQTPVWEWVVGAIGLLFLLGILGFLLYEATQPITPPAITVSTALVVATEGGYLVEIRVMNVGETTGAAVEVEGTLKRSNDAQAQPVETSQITFDYIPAKSSRRGGLFFREDPNQYILEVQARGYVAP